MCRDRYCVSDRVAAALATSILQDFSVKNKYGDSIIIDKHRIRRERQANRNKIIKETMIDPIIKSFSFDSKKNHVLIEKKTDDNRLHPRIITEMDIII